MVIDAHVCHEMSAGLCRVSQFVWSGPTWMLGKSHMEVFAERVNTLLLSEFDLVANAL